MAVTVLKHIKEAKNRSPSSHLKNAIKYIMNPKKTEEGLWIGGNVGNTPDAVYKAMIDTKTDYGKLYGRQGYHFVVSFAPGESDAETTFLIGQEFCRKYLGDNYDYAFAVHNDQHHSHCHIIFNSVNRMNGSKYRYVDGDWKKFIQPVTDEICIKRGLPPLTYDETEKKSRSYAEHLAQKEGRFTGKDLIRYDIDHAVSAAASFEDYLRIMQEMGYRIREGHSEAKGCNYMTYYAPGNKKGRRDLNLGRGYTIADIKRRITGEMKVTPEYPKLPTHLEMQNLWQKNKDSCFRRPYVLRVVFAVMYHRVGPVPVDPVKVRQDLMDINRLQEECTYMMQHGIEDADQINERMLELKQQEKMLRQQGMGNGEKTNTEESGTTDKLYLIREEKKILRRIQKNNEETQKRAELQCSDKTVQKLLSAPAGMQPEKTDKYVR